MTGGWSSVSTCSPPPWAGFLCCLADKQRGDGPVALPSTYWTGDRRGINIPEAASGRECANPINALEPSTSPRVVTPPPRGGGGGVPEAQPPPPSQRRTTQELPTPFLGEERLSCSNLLPGRKFHSGSCFPHLPIFVRKFRLDRFFRVFFAR